jgi:antitoxin component YwqK of YwqJK toxin-antitoxin module/peroxiredoxin
MFRSKKITGQYLKKTELTAPNSIQTMRIRFAVNLLALLLSVLNVSAQQTAGLPKAVLYDKAGRQIATSSISDFDNPIIIVTYSESWCTPCVDLISKFDRNYATSAKNSSVKIIAVNVDKSLASTDVFTKAKRWTNIEVLHDKYGDFQTALYTTRAPSVLFMNDHQQVIHTESTYNLDVAKAYKLADQLKRNLINAEKIYFDKDWFPVPDAEGMYYRQLKRNGDNDWEVNDYFKNGQLQMRGKAVIPYPLVRTGKYSYFYQNGKLQSESFYNNNQLSGKAMGWYENGNEQYEYNYVNGLYDGKWILYHDNGKTANTGLYVNGKATGTWYHYYPSGKKWKETMWKDGKREGRCQAWYENGKLKFDVVFKNDEVSDEPKPRYLHANGSSAFEIKSPTSIAYYYEGGQTYLTVERVDDLLEVNLYYENGKPWYRVTMSDDETVNGKYIVWYNNGNKQAEATMFNNIPNGKAMAWWENGTVRERVDFTNDTREYFDKQGVKLSAAPKEVFFLVRKGEKVDVSSLSNSIRWLELAVKQEGKMEE